MFGIGLVELAPLVAVLLTLALLVGVARHEDIVARREWGLIRATRVLGVVAGAAGALWMLGHSERLPYGLSMLLAPSVFGLGVVLGVALGETVVRRRRVPGPRTASLRPRAAAAYLPRITSRAVAVATVLLLVTLTATTLTASRTDDGHLRGLTCRTATVTHVSAPYPGAYYSLPLAALMAVTFAVAAIAARQVVMRPRGLASTEHGDDVLRQRSLIVIVAAVGVAGCVSLTGVAIVAGGALLRSSCVGGTPLGATLMTIAGLSLLLGLWCLVRVFGNDPLDRRWS